VLSDIAIEEMMNRPLITGRTLIKKTDELSTVIIIINNNENQHRNDDSSFTMLGETSIEE